MWLVALTSLAVWAGLTAGTGMGADTAPVWAGLGLSAAGVWFVRGRAWLALPLVAAAFAWGLLSAPSTAPVGQPGQSGTVRLRGRVLRSSCGTSGCYSELETETCTAIDSGAVCPSRGEVVGLARAEELPLWASVRLVARVAERVPFRNPGPHPPLPDVRPRFRASEERAAPIAIVNDNRIGSLLRAARVTVRRAFDETLGPPHAGIARALLLGEGSAVDPELDTAIRAAGVSHVLAVSGMHVTVLAGALVSLVRFVWSCSSLSIWLPAARAAAACGVVLAPLVTAFCGGSPSAWRAGVTSTLMFALQALGRRPCALRVSCVAVAVYAVAEPRASVHPGFVLSVLATAALLTGGGAGEGSWAVLRESLRAWIATMPFLVWAFGTTSLVALLANVLLLPLGAALIPVCVAHVASALSGMSGMLPTGWVFETTSGAFVSASRFFAGLDPGIALPPPTPVQGIALTAAAITCLVRMPARVKALVIALCLLAIGAGEWAVRGDLARGALRVTFLDVGQGDAALLELGTGQAALIDGGGAVNGGPDPGAQAIVPLLRALRIAKLDLIVLTHPHPDHYGGLRAVIDAFDVRELWDTGQGAAEDAQGAATRLIEHASARGARVVRPDTLCGSAAPQLGALALEVLSPCPGFDETLGPNDNSFVIRARFGERSFLFTGDAEQPAERALLHRASASLRADVLKVGHHGSRTSSTEPFARAIQPWLAVISAGRGNRFGHPHEEVSERLSRLAGHVLRTDQVGGIRVLTDGERLEVETLDGEALLLGAGH